MRAREVWAEGREELGRQSTGVARPKGKKKISKKFWSGCAGGQAGRRIGARCALTTLMSGLVQMWWQPWRSGGTGRSGLWLTHQHVWRNARWLALEGWRREAINLVKWEGGVRVQPDKVPKAFFASIIAFCQNVRFLALPSTTNWHWQFPRA